MTTLAEDSPAAFFAVMMYSFLGTGFVGTPEMVPIDGSKYMPSGNAGELSHEVAWPVTSGSTVTGSPACKVSGQSYRKPAGALNTTAMLHTQEDFPVSFWAVMVYACFATGLAGEPEITPVVEDKLKPSGNAGVTVKVMSGWIPCIKSCSHCLLPPF